MTDKNRRKKSFIPYRDSKLTRILKQSLGGNALTSILCTATAAPMHFEETISTLKFGALCKTIKNKPKNNTRMDDKVLLVQANIKIHELERNKATEVMQLQDKIADLELRLSQARALDNAQADNAAIEQVSQCVFIVGG